MSEEELRQEFEKYFEQKNNEGYLWVTQEMEQSELKDDCEMVCLDFAEPREKQIEIDAKQIRALQKQNGELTDKVKELEAQIKKMQNCRNCKNEKIEGACGHFTQVGWCKDWELAD